MPRLPRRSREAVAATGPFDIVDVFRRSELCVPHAEEAVAVGARCLWLQLGVVNWEAARIAAAAGLAVVMDRCTAIELAGSALSRRGAAATGSGQLAPENAGPVPARRWPAAGPWGRSVLSTTRRARTQEQVRKVARRSPMQVWPGRADARRRPAADSPGRDQRMTKPTTIATSADDRDRGADLGLAAEDGHRHRRAGRAGVVADAAAPRLVAGDVGVLRLEVLVARPRAACPRVAEPRSGAPPPTHRTRLIGPTAQPSPEPASPRRARRASWTSAAFAWPRGRLHDLADEEADRRLAGPVVGDGRRVRGQDLVDDRAERADVRDLAQAAAPRRSRRPRGRRARGARRGPPSRSPARARPRRRGADEVGQLGASARPTRPVGVRVGSSLRRPAVLAGDQVRDLLGAAVPGRRARIASNAAVMAGSADDHRRVVGGQAELVA